jgi:hypothetical protein
VLRGCFGAALPRNAPTKGGSTATCWMSSRMLAVRVLARMLEICERTVEMATP